MIPVKFCERKKKKKKLIINRLLEHVNYYIIWLLPK